MVWSVGRRAERGSGKGVRRAKRLRGQNHSRASNRLNRDGRFAKRRTMATVSFLTPRRNFRGLAAGLRTFQGLRVGTTLTGQGSAKTSSIFSGVTSCVNFWFWLWVPIPPTTLHACTLHPWLFAGWAGGLTVRMMRRLESHSAYILRRPKKHHECRFQLSLSSWLSLRDQITAPWLLMINDGPADRGISAHPRPARLHPGPAVIGKRNYPYTIMFMYPGPLLSVVGPHYQARQPDFSPTPPPRPGTNQPTHRHPPRGLG